MFASRTQWFPILTCETRVWHCVFMTQRRRTKIGDWQPTPTQVVAHRVRELRREHGWSAQALADRCAAAGMPHLGRDVLANLEAGRRDSVSIDEVLCLAVVLDVAPIDLFVPPSKTMEHHKYGEVDLSGYRVTPTQTVTPLTSVRGFVVGKHPLHGMDERRYRSQRPDEASGPSAEDVLAYLQTLQPKGSDDGQC